ncbi:hypothetical protein A2U01_0058927, partial [Trifolium medium]|nr:hypothetical protein [Trifolium medium]
VVNETGVWCLCLTRVPGVCVGVSVSE